MSPQFFTVSGNCLQTVRNPLAALLLSWLCTCSTVVGGATQLASTLPWPYGASASCMGQFKEKGSFLRCYCFCSEFAKEYIYVYVYIYIKLLITSVLGKVLNE